METQKPVFSGLALASLVMGILSFVNVFGLEKSLAAVAFALLARRELAVRPEWRGKGLALTGLILGLAAVAATAVFLILYGQDLFQFLGRLSRR